MQSYDNYMQAYDHTLNYYYVSTFREFLILLFTFSLIYLCPFHFAFFATV